MDLRITTIRPISNEYLYHIFTVPTCSLSAIMRETHARAHTETHHRISRVGPDNVMKACLFVCFSSVTSHRIYATRPAGPSEYPTGIDSGSRGTAALLKRHPRKEHTGRPNGLPAEKEKGSEYSAAKTRGGGGFETVPTSTVTDPLSIGETISSNPARLVITCRCATYSTCHLSTHTSIPGSQPTEKDAQHMDGKSKT